jgi:large subunit ribosomal protein L1
MATRPITRPSGLTPLLQHQILPLRTCRSFSSTPIPAKKVDKLKIEAAKKAKVKAKKNQKQRDPYFKVYDMKDMKQFALCDAVRYIQAFEIGKASPTSKYEVHIRLKTKRTGATIRPNQLKLPHAVKADVRFAVVCPPGKAANAAKAAGAVLVGEEDIFEALKTGSVPFERLLAHPLSLPKLQKSGLPRILGPRGLMPNTKNGTITTDPKTLIANMAGGALFQERFGVVRMAIGKLSFTPEMLRDNLRAFINRVKAEIKKLPEEGVKEINEIVLSSTKAPGFSLNGMFKSEASVPTELLAAGALPAP